MNKKHQRYEEEFSQHEPISESSKNLHQALGEQGDGESSYVVAVYYFEKEDVPAAKNWARKAINAPYKAYGIEDWAIMQGLDLTTNDESLMDVRHLKNMSKNEFRMIKAVYEILDRGNDIANSTYDPIDKQKPTMTTLIDNLFSLFFSNHGLSFSMAYSQVLGSIKSISIRTDEGKREMPVSVITNNDYFPKVGDNKVCSTIGNDNYTNYGWTTNGIKWKRHCLNDVSNNSNFITQCIIIETTKDEKRRMVSTKEISQLLAFLEKDLAGKI